MLETKKQKMPLTYNKSLASTRAAHTLFSQLLKTILKLTDLVKFAVIAK